MNHKVRDELLKMMAERDKAMNETKEIKEALSMSKDQLNNANTEMKKLTQENALLKRDQRQLLVMATQNQSSTGGSSNTWDLEYYKRKVICICATSITTWGTLFVVSLLFHTFRSPF